MSTDFKLTTIRENKEGKIERAYFGFEGGWNHWGEELFYRIPCGNCGKKFTEKDVQNENYDIWVNRKLMWINYEPHLWKDRYLIEYKVNDLTPAGEEWDVEDEERVSKMGYPDFRDVGDFMDGKDLVLKANFVITNLTHKKPCVEEKKEPSWKEGKLFGMDIKAGSKFTMKVKKNKDGKLEMVDFKESKENE